jgi:hypothetical protein
MQLGCCATVVATVKAKADIAHVAAPIFMFSLCPMWDAQTTQKESCKRAREIKGLVFDRLGYLCMRARSLSLSTGRCAIDDNTQHSPCVFLLCQLDIFVASVAIQIL